MLLTIDMIPDQVKDILFQIATRLLHAWKYSV